MQRLRSQLFAFADQRAPTAICLKAVSRAEHYPAHRHNSHKLISIFRGSAHVDALHHQNRSHRCRNN